MSQDAAQIRGRIISFIRDNGPSLPVQIARDTGLSILFASAFLSELFGEKIINISNLRVGSSPLYFLPGQEPQLERFSQYVKGKEKEAYLLLKDKKILRDSEMQPAIRVALREIKDFAIPFEKNDEIFWRYFLIEEPSDFAEERSEINKRSREQEKIEMDIIEVEEEPEEVIDEEENEISRAENISDGVGESLHEHQFQNASVGSSREGISEEISDKQIPKKEKSQKKIKSETKVKKINKNEKKDDNFFNTIKEFLSKKEIEIIDIKDFKNNEALLKVKKDNQEELLFVFNKKRISEKEILNAHKISSEEKMPYSILSLGETTKKLNDLILAIKTLSSIDKIE
jgi:hypothetical protein